MPIQHSYLPRRLALAIALALGCANVSMAQQPAHIPTTAEQQQRLEAFAEAADTRKQNANVPRKGNAKWTGKNDLVIVSANAKFPGSMDGGGGTNMLRLDLAKHPVLGETRNFEALQVSQGEWEHTARFAGWGVVEPQATLVNTGHIDGRIGVLGAFDNKGAVANGVMVEPGGRMTHSGTAHGGVHVHEAASFSGNGTVDFLTMAGRWEVGPDVGAPSITGNLELSRSAELVYGIDANGGSASIQVEGTATLNDSTLTIVAVPADSLSSSEHTVIRAGNVVGEFGTVIDNLPFMTATAHYTDTQVGLTYVRNDTPLETAATSDNGKQLAASIEEPQPVEPPQPKPVETPALAKAVATKPNAPTMPSKPAAALRVTPPARTPNAAVNALLGSNRIVAADAIEQLAGQTTANLANATLNSIAPISAGMLSAMGQRPVDGQVWIQAIGHGGTIGRQLGSDALKHSTKGLMLGTDWAISPEWRLGMMGSETRTQLDGHRLDAGLDSWYLGAYAWRQDGPMALRLGAVHGDHDGSTKRHVVFNGFNDHLKGRYDASTQQVFGQLGYRFDLGRYDLEPYAQLDYQRYQRDRYTEKGGDSALRVDRQTEDHYSSTLGLRLATALAFDQGTQLTPRLNVGWRHLYGDVRGSARQSLVKGGRTYTVQGSDLDRDSLLVEAGLDLAVSPRHTLGLGYSGETGNDNRSHALMGQWRMMF